MLEQPTSDGSVSKFNPSFAVLHNHRNFPSAHLVWNYKTWAVRNHSFFNLDRLHITTYLKPRTQHSLDPSKEKQIQIKFNKIQFPLPTARS